MPGALKKTRRYVIGIDRQDNCSFEFFSNCFAFQLYNHDIIHYCKMISVDGHSTSQMSSSEGKNAMNDDEKQYAPSGYHDHLRSNIVEPIFCTEDISNHFSQL